MQMVARRQRSDWHGPRKLCRVRKEGLGQNSEKYQHLEEEENKRSYVKDGEEKDPPRTNSPILASKGLQSNGDNSENAKQCSLTGLGYQQ